jgi:Mg/Co/Ni transporter MgtE
MLVAEQIMNDRYVEVGAETSVGRAVQRLLDERAGLVAVTDAHRRLHGLLPDTVLLRAAIDTQLAHDPVSIHMQRQFATVHRKAPADLVLDQFVLHDLQILPVIEEGRIVGVIDRFDVLRGVLGSDDAADASLSFRGTASATTAGQ